MPEFFPRASPPVAIAWRWLAWRWLIWRWLMRGLASAALLFPFAFPGAAQSARPMTLSQSTYQLRPGEATQIAAPPDTIEFLSTATRRSLTIEGSQEGGLVVSPNRDHTAVLLGASLRTKPGAYTVELSASSPAGEERVTTMAVVVNTLPTVPSSATRPPVVLLNGWETGFTNACPVATSSSDTFGNLAQYLVSDGAPVVYLFDNCLEDPNQTIEVLGNDLGTFLNSITYDDGTQVPQIDLVAFSMGGLITRAYLAGLQPGETVMPPTTTLVRDLVMIAVPNFGSFVAGTYAVAIGAGTQSAELIPASSFLWNLATWNQRQDDLRGVNTIAVVGNAGTYTGGVASTVSLANASDGIVSLTSASLSFVAQDPADTRIVPYCHIDPSAFTNTSFGTFACNAAGIANVTSTSQETGEIVRSFLAGTTDWTSIGGSPSADPYLSADGGLYFALVSAANKYYADLSQVTWGTVALTNGGDAGTVYYDDFIAGTGVLDAASASAGTLDCGSLEEPLGYFSAARCKVDTAIFSVGPLAGGSARIVNSGGNITIAGNAFGSSKCSGCQVQAIPAGSTAGSVLQVSSWSNTSITAALPASFTGLATIVVLAAAGSDAINIMTLSPSAIGVSPSSLQFSYAAGGTLPSAQSIQISNSGTGTLNWTATASVSSSVSWLSVSPSSGTAPSTLSVSISQASLAPGNYTGSIQITAAGAANSPQSVSVTLTVAAGVPALAVTPSALSFSYTFGGAAPTAQAVSIANVGTGTLSWSASDSDFWIALSPSSGAGAAALSVAVNPANLAAGTYTTNVVITAPGAGGSPISVPVTLVVQGTQPAGVITGIGNAATYLPGFASATWVTIVGTNLSQTTATWQAGNFVNGLLPVSLDGVSVTIDGLPAYVEYISPTQINVLAPDDAMLGPVPIQVTTAGQPSNSVAAQKQQFAPAFFTLGNGAYVAALHADGTVVGQPNLLGAGVDTQPASPGEIIALYATGFGPTNPSTPTADLVAAPAMLANSVQVTIGGMAANVAYAGLVEAGLYQLNVTVPSLPGGDALVVAQIGGVQTQPAVSISIQ